MKKYFNKSVFMAVIFSVIFSVSFISEAQSRGGSGSGKWINPVYKNNSVTFERKYAGFSDLFITPETVYYSSVEEAGEGIRDELAGRELRFATGLTFDVSELEDKDILVDGELDEDWVDELVYDIFLTACEHTGNGKEGDAILWCTGGYSYNYSYDFDSENLILENEYLMSYYTDSDDEAELDEAVKGVLDELDVYDGTNYEKAVAIYNYICDNVKYDYYHLGINPNYLPMYTAHAALVDGKAVCQGYALLFYRLALELDVDTRFIGGITDEDEPHAWNIVRLGTEYYNLDSTWDAGEDESNYGYFLRGSGFFDEEHYRDSEYITDEFLYEYPVPMYDFDPAEYNPDGEHLHSFALTEVTDVTCVSDGSRIYLCRCGYSETVVVKSEGHLMMPYEATEDATCISKGKEISECRRCDYTTEREIPLKKHDYYSVSIAPTCIEGGYTEYICRFCQSKYRADYTEKTGHNVVNLPGVSPDCTNKGLTPGVRCTVCNQDVVEQLVIPENGHISGKAIVEKATFFENGKNIYKCRICKNIISEKITKKADITDYLNIRFSKKKNNTIKVSWDKIGKADTYIFFYSTDKKNWKKKEVISTSATVKDFRTDAEYFFKIVAVRGDRQSNESGIFNLSLKPDKITVNSAVSKKKGQIRISWNRITGITGYQISCSSSKKFSKKTTVYTNISKAKTAVKTIKKLSSGKKYFIKMRAFKNISGKKVYGAYSKVMTVKVK